MTALVTGATVYEGRLRGALTSAKVEGDRADENYKAARDAVRKMLQRTRDRRWNEVPRMRHLQREQFEDALAFFDSIARQQSNDPSVRQDIAWALLEMGKVQNTLGRAEQTRDSLRRADRLTEELLADRPDDPDARLLRADLLLTYGAILHGLKPEGVPYLEKAAALLEDLTRDFPDLSQARTGLANSLITLGGSYLSLDRYADGERCLLRAIGLFDELILTDPDHSAVARAKARLNLAALYRAWKKGAELKQQHALAEAELERLYARDNADRTVTRALALLRINRAYDFGAEGDHSKAVEYVSGNVPMLEAARRREPDDVELRLDLHRTHGVRATMLQHLGRKAECARAWEKSMALCQADGVHGMRYTHVSLLLDAGELTRAEAAADTLRDEIARRPTAAAWGHLAGYYEALARATKDEPQRQRCREAAEKFKKASDGKKH